MRQSVFGIHGDAEREGVGGAGISRVDGAISRRTSSDFVQVPTPLEGTGGGEHLCSEPSVIPDVHGLLHIRGLLISNTQHQRAFISLALHCGTALLLSEFSVGGGGGGGA